MEKIVFIAPTQKVTASDLSNIGGYARESMDHMIRDGIDNGVAYTGFNVAKASAQTKVLVGNGRFYKKGAVYYNDDEGGVTVDFVSNLPGSTLRIGAIVAFGNDQTVQTEQREFLKDALTNQTVARVTSTEKLRRATIDKVMGDPGTTPVRPSIDPNTVCIAWVTLDSTGVVSVEPNGETLLRSSREAYSLAALLGVQVGSFAPQLTSLQSDLSRLARRVDTRLDADFGYRMANDISELKDRVGVPDLFIDYGSDVFLDKSETDIPTTGTTCKIMDGLRFPDVAMIESDLRVKNPLDASVIIHPNGLVLPVYKETRQRIVAGASGNIALNAAYYDTSSILVADLARTRQRNGDEFVVSTASAFYKSAQFFDVARLNFQVNGEVFQTFDSNIYDANGVKMVRVQKVWTDTPATPYWTRTSGNPTFSGYKYAQTFLNGQDRWLTGVGMHFASSDPSAPVTFMLMECLENGQPNEKKVLGVTTITADKIATNNIFTKVPMSPVFIEQGKTYAICITTAGNIRMNIADSTVNAVGALFFKNGQGYWQTDASKNLLTDIHYAEFTYARTEIQLEDLQLAGGVASLDLQAQMVVPSGVKGFFEVLVGNAWKSLTKDVAGANSPFATLPSVVPLRFVTEGGNLSQAGAIFAPQGSSIVGCRARVSRPGPNLTHYSITRTSPAATTKVQTSTRINNYKSAKHAVTPKVLAGGIEYAGSPATINILGPDPDNVGAQIAEVVAIHTIPSGTTMKQVTRATTTDTADPCVVSRAAYVFLPT